jgi:hypothetical protein
LLDQQSADINKMDAVIRARSAVEAEKINKVNAGKDLGEM